MFTPTHMFTLLLYVPLTLFLVFKPSHMPFFYFPSPTADSSCLSHMMSIYALYCQLSYSFHSSIHLLIICPKRQHAGGGDLHGNNRREVGWHFLLIDIWRRSTRYVHALFLSFVSEKREQTETLETIRLIPSQLVIPWIELGMEHPAHSVTEHVPLFSFFKKTRTVGHRDTVLDSGTCSKSHI